MLLLFVNPIAHQVLTWEVQNVKSKSLLFTADEIEKAKAKGSSSELSVKKLIPGDPLVMPR